MNSYHEKHHNQHNSQKNKQINKQLLYGAECLTLRKRKENVFSAEIQELVV